MKKRFIMCLLLFVFLFSGNTYAQEQYPGEKVTPTHCLQNLLRPDDYKTWHHTLIQIDHGNVYYISRNPNPTPGTISEVTTHIVLSATDRYDGPAQSIRYSYSVGTEDCEFSSILPVEEVLAIF